jgi:cell division inhibitor SepF
MAGAWRKTLIYLGLVEDDELDEYGYDDLMEEEEEAPPPSRRESRRRSSQPAERRDAVVRAMPSPVGSSMHHLSPRNFEGHAQELGDKFRSGAIVIMDLKSTDEETKKRLKNFAAGLVYGLQGDMRRVGDEVYALSPRGVEVSAEEQRRFLEERGLFNEA